MTDLERISGLQNRMKVNVETGILPFWRKYLTDEKNGGFYGRVCGDLTPDLDSPKSAVLNCRLLWTFSRAYALYKREEDRVLADRAFSYIRDYFWDKKYGGIYWMLTCKGEPSEPEKRTYSQAFLIYAMAEYYRVFQKEEALKMAMETFRLVNANMKWQNGGYRDSAARDWQQDDWVNLWIKNRTGAAKLLNSNMHLFEGILNLAETVQDECADRALREELEFLLDTAMDRRWGHLKAGMSENGRRLDGEINYGHDCECSYLMTRAARRLKDDALIKRADETALTLIDHVELEGFDRTEGGLFYIRDGYTGKENKAKIWWVQAEGITAFFNAYQLTGEKRYLNCAIAIWNYTEKFLVNHETGDWNSIGGCGTGDPEYEKDVLALRDIFTNEEKAGKGKCPYHNTRACFEIVERADQVLRRKDYE